MKKLIIGSLLVLLGLIGAPLAHAQSQVPSGGTGVKSIVAGAITFGNGVNPIATSSMLKISTSTSVFTIGNGVASFYTNMGCNQGTACLQITQNNISGIGLEINANSNNATAKAIRVYNSGLQDIFDIFSNGDTYSTGVFTLIGGAGIAGNVGISGILTATTSTITGPCAVTCLTVKNTDPDGGAAALKSDATPSAQHTFTIGYNALKGGLVNIWMDNNGNVSLSGSGTGSTTIGVADSLIKSKALVNGNLIVATSSTERDAEMNDPAGVHIAGDLSIGVTCLDHADNGITNKFQFCGDGFITGAVHLFSTLQVDSTSNFSSTLTAAAITLNGALTDPNGSVGKNTDIFQSNGTSGAWASTTKDFNSFQQAPSSKFNGSIAESWWMPGVGGLVNLPSSSLTANTMYAVPYVFTYDRTLANVAAMVTGNVAGASVNCFIYTSSSDSQLIPDQLVYSQNISASSVGFSQASTTAQALKKNRLFWFGVSSTSTPAMRGLAVAQLSTMLGIAGPGSISWNSFASTTATSLSPFPTTWPTPGGYPYGIAPPPSCLWQFLN